MTDKHGSDLTLIDLFCGCGGFSIGMQDAGLRCVAAVDHSEAAIETYKAAHPSVGHALAKDLRSYRPSSLAKLIGTNHVDVIVGGPPCQGFSKARAANGNNHGQSPTADGRRDLYKEFLRFVEFFKPKVFVMENVPGIRTAVGGRFFTQVQAESRAHGYRVIPFEINSWQFGVPQKRIRQLIIGTLNNLPYFSPEQEILATHALPGEKNAESLLPFISLGEAIGDLPLVRRDDTKFFRHYDLARRKKHIETYGDRFVYGVLKADEVTTLTGHFCRVQSDRDLRDFAKLKEGENSKQALARGVEMEFPYNRESFKDRYTKQSRNGLCSTIVAHMKKDGLMYIHPTQNRTLSPREAARIQSFPDTFPLPTIQSHSYEQIGNAFPPLVAKAVGAGIKRYLSESLRRTTKRKTRAISLPKTRNKAINFLENFIESVCIERLIEEVPKNEFMQVWAAITALHPRLHPDSAIKPGREISPGPERGVSLVLEPYYIESGWPVELIPVAIEARRRFQRGELLIDDYYCSHAIDFAYQAR
jgi:DNA (cytosine-5)-methyltransferase 1